MTGFLHHWVWIDYWIPVWPNLAASPTVAAYVAVSHVVRERAARRRHTELMQDRHCTGCTCAGEAQ